MHKIEKNKFIMAEENGKIFNGKDRNEKSNELSL